MPLLKILTDPQNFRFYSGGQGYTSNSTSFGQKSIKYGNDRLNSANSGQPYITVGIPGDYSQGDKTRLEQYIGTKDFLLRGGPTGTILNSFTDVKNLIGLNSVSDFLRIGKMFFDTKSPNGLFFTIKQQLLSRTAVRTQASGILNEGIYDPLNTLAQVGVVAFGGHLNKQGGNPFANTGAYSNNNNLYFNVVKPNPNSPGESTTNNRLVKLLELTNNQISGTKKKGITLNNGPNVMTYTGGPGSELGAGNTNIRYSDQRTGINNFLFKNDKNYFYGKFVSKFNPDSLKYYKTIFYNDTNYGVSGKYARLSNVDLINAYNPDGTLGGYYNFNVYEPAIEGNTWPKNSPLIYANNTYTYTQQDIIASNINEQGSGGSPKIQDFRKVLREKLGDTTEQGKAATNSGATSLSPDYNDKNIEQRVNLGNPGQRSGKSYADYTKGVIDKSTNKSYYSSINTNIGSFNPGLDKITSVPIYRSDAVINDEKLNDLVKFRIAILDNNIGNNNQVFKMFMHFRAFLGPMSDSYNAEWNPFRYLGRGENFYTYGGFTRQISLSWTVAAQSKQELIPMYKKLNYLASSLTPDYSPQGYMRGNLAQLTVGGYLYEQPGIITNLTYDIQEDTPWEIGINTDGGSDGTVKELPHIIRVSNFSFIPIQDFVPRKQELNFSIMNIPDSPFNDTGFVSLNGSGDQRYISLTNGLSDNYNT